MARKGWEQLSPGYRARIEKAGLTRKDYEQGAPIKAARGHGQTPESPKNVDPKQFPKYAAERAKLTKQVEQKKAQMFGGSKRWNSKKSAKHSRDKPPSMALLRWALTASEQEILDAIREDPEAYYFLGYG